MQERNRDITSVSSSGGPGAEGMCRLPFPYSLPYLEAIVNFYILAPTFSKPRDCNLLLHSSQYLCMNFLKKPFLWRPRADLVTLLASASKV